MASIRSRLPLPAIVCVLLAVPLSATEMAAGQDCRLPEGIASQAPMPAAECLESAPLVTGTGMYAFEGSGAPAPEATESSIWAATSWLWLLGIAMLILAGFNTRKRNRPTHLSEHHDQEVVDYRRGRG